MPASLDLDDIADTTLKRVRSLVPGDTVSLYLGNDAERRLEVVAVVALVTGKGRRAQVDGGGAALLPPVCERQLTVPRVDEVAAVLVGLRGDREPLGVLLGPVGCGPDLAVGEPVAHVVPHAPGGLALDDAGHRSAVLVGLGDGGGQRIGQEVLEGLSVHRSGSLGLAVRVSAGGVPLA